MRKKLVPHRVHEGEASVKLQDSEVVDDYGALCADGLGECGSTTASAETEGGRERIEEDKDNDSTEQVVAGRSAVGEYGEAACGERACRRAASDRQDAEKTNESDAGLMYDAVQLEVLDVPEDAVIISPQAPPTPVQRAELGNAARKRKLDGTGTQQSGAQKDDGGEWRRELGRWCYDTVKCSICTERVQLSQANVRGTAQVLGEHPVLGVACCHRCVRMYEAEMRTERFSAGADGNHAACTWCACGGQLVLCDTCPRAFCRKCVRTQLGRAYFARFEELDDDAAWRCLVCSPPAELRALQSSARKMLEAVRREYDRLCDKRKGSKSQAQRQAADAETTGTHLAATAGAAKRKPGRPKSASTASLACGPRSTEKADRTADGVEKPRQSGPLPLAGAGMTSAMVVYDEQGRPFYAVPANGVTTGLVQVQLRDVGHLAASSSFYRPGPGPKRKPKQKTDSDAHNSGSSHNEGRVRAKTKLMATSGTGKLNGDVEMVETHGVMQMPALPMSTAERAAASASSELAAGEQDCVHAARISTSCVARLETALTQIKEANRVLIDASAPSEVRRKHASRFFALLAKFITNIGDMDTLDVEGCWLLEHLRYRDISHVSHSLLLSPPQPACATAAPLVPQFESLGATRSAMGNSPAAGAPSPSIWHARALLEYANGRSPVRESGSAMVAPALRLRQIESVATLNAANEPKANSRPAFGTAGKAATHAKGEFILVEDSDDSSSRIQAHKAGQVGQHAVSSRPSVFSQLASGADRRAKATEGKTAKVKRTKPTDDAARTTSKKANVMSDAPLDIEAAQRADGTEKRGRSDNAAIPKHGRKAKAITPDDVPSNATSSAHLPNGALHSASRDHRSTASEAMPTLNARVALPSRAAREATQVKIELDAEVTAPTKLNKPVVGLHGVSYYNRQNARWYPAKSALRSCVSKSKSPRIRTRSLVHAFEIAVPDFRKLYPTIKMQQGVIKLSNWQRVAGI